MAKNRIKTRTGTFTLEEGVLWQVPDPGTSITLEHARENIRAMDRLCQGKKYPVFLDIRGLKSVSREARAHYSGPATAPYVTAIAILTGSPLSKIIANFFVGLNRSPAFPIKLFMDEKTALAWLKGLLV